MYIKLTAEKIHCISFSRTCFCARLLFAPFLNIGSYGREYSLGPSISKSSDFIIRTKWDKIKLIKMHIVNDRMIATIPNQFDDKMPGRKWDFFWIVRTQIADRVPNINKSFTRWLTIRFVFMHGKYWLNVACRMRHPCPTLNHTKNPSSANTQHY